MEQEKELAPASEDAKFEGATFAMVAKTMKGLEAVLADELRALGAADVEPGHRMVSFRGDKAMLYKANLCCRTALRILKPFYTFRANDADTLYDCVKQFDWSTLMTVDKTFAIDAVVYSDTFTHSRFVTYRVKDAIADWFRDHCDGKRPGVRLDGADVLINVHISGSEVTLSLDSSGESLHRRGYRAAQTEAPINEVLAAGIILMSGYRGQSVFLDPMCGSGTFVIEAAMIAANINPGVYRKGFAFEQWPDFDAELFESLYNDDSNEREVEFPIIGTDISPVAIDIATRNAKGAGVMKYITLETKPLSQWTEAPAPQGVIVTNPPYGERISAPDMEGLYTMIGSTLKHVFTGWEAWIIGYREEYFQKIGLAPSEKVSLLNGSLDCELREYVIFEGNKRDFRRAGGKLKEDKPARDRKQAGRKPFDKDRKMSFKDKDERRRFFTGKGKDDGRKPFDKEFRKPFDKDGRKPFDKDSRKPFDKDFRKPFDKQGEGAVVEPENENPLAKRRNPDALKMLQNKMPSLAKSEGPIMRSRGWKRKDK